MTTVDARGKSCPLPIVLLAKAVKAIGVGETVTIQADDRAFPPDLEAWCQRTGNQLVSLDRNDAGYFDAIVRRR
jgi:tRNA 2-thiouridine synthesizing protein A